MKSAYGAAVAVVMLAAACKPFQNVPFSSNSAPRTKSESNNKLDNCLRRAYSKVDDQVHARAVCFGSGKAMAEGVPHLE